MTDKRSDGGTAMALDSVPESDTEAAATDSVGDRLGLAARQIRSLAGTEIRLALRRRWAVTLIGLFAAFGLLVLTFAGSAPGPAGYARILASLATLCVYVVPLAALAYGYDAVVGPADSGWLDVVSALPVTRVRILLATAVGRGVVLAGGVALGFLLPAGLLTAEYGLETWPWTAAVVLGATGLGLAFLSIAVAVSTLVREKTHALGVALLAWVWFVLVHDLLALGFVAAFDLPGAAVSAMVLANPTSVYRVLVLDLLGAGGTGGFGALLSSTGLSPTLLVAALVAWAVLPVAGAAALVRWRGRIAAI